jgi:hypothetical protein
MPSIAGMLSSAGPTLPSTATAPRSTASFNALAGIGDAERHRIGRRPMLLAEIRDLAGIVHVEQEVDVALRVAADILRLVRADMGEAHLHEQIGQRIGIGPGEFDEFEAVEAHRIVGRPTGRTGFK